MGKGISELLDDATRDGVASHLGGKGEEPGQPMMILKMLRMLKIEEPTNDIVDRPTQLTCLSDINLSTNN